MTQLSLFTIQLMFFCLFFLLFFRNNACCIALFLILIIPILDCFYDFAIVFSLLDRFTFCSSHDFAAWLLFVMLYSHLSLHPCCSFIINSHLLSSPAICICNASVLHPSSVLRLLLFNEISGRNLLKGGSMQQRGC